MPRNKFRRDLFSTIVRLGAFVLLTSLLGACVNRDIGSVTGGECKVFQRPPNAVRGLRQYDQDWIDSTIEGGVGGCHWARPAPRPAQLDAPPAVTRKPVTAPAPKKKPGLLRRIHDGMLGKPTAEPVVAPEAAEPPASTLETPDLAPPVEPQQPPDPPPAPKRSALDELLHPSGRN
jgi:hypothetical protein